MAKKGIYVSFIDSKEKEYFTGLFNYKEFDSIVKETIVKAFASNTNVPKPEDDSVEVDVSVVIDEFVKTYNERDKLKLDNEMLMYHLEACFKDVKIYKGTKGNERIELRLHNIVSEGA